MERVCERRPRGRLVRCIPWGFWLSKQPGTGQACLPHPGAEKSSPAVGNSRREHPRGGRSVDAETRPLPTPLLPSTQPPLLAPPHLPLLGAH